VGLTYKQALRGLFTTGTSLLVLGGKTKEKVGGKQRIDSDKTGSPYNHAGQNRK